MDETLRRIAGRHLRQNEPGTHKEWFHSPHGDLLLRRTPDARGPITGFELTFRPTVGAAERIVEWSAAGGLRVGRVDTGERPGGVKAAPVVDFGPDATEALLLRAAAAFVADPARRLRPDLRTFLLERLQPPGA